jgi:hypothetical protein
MMGIDHVVADLEIDVLDYTLNVEIFDLQGCLGNRVLLVMARVRGRTAGSRLQVPVHEVDLL